VRGILAEAAGVKRSSAVEGPEAAAQDGEDDTLLRAQALACHLVQVFFMSNSVRREVLDEVAAAAAHVALRAVGRPSGMREILSACNAQRASQEEPELGGEAGPQLHDTPAEAVLEVEGRLMELTTSVLPDLPLDSISDLVGILAAHLPDCTAFKAACPRDGVCPGPAIMAGLLVPQLAEATRCFVSEALLSMAPLFWAPRVVAAGALWLAAVYTLRKAGRGAAGLEGELSALLEGELRAAGTGAAPLRTGELALVVSEILDVFRLWEEEAPRLRCKKL
jgi:hypothetical protein